MIKSSLDEGNHVNIRPASLAEVVAVNQGIEEFNNPYGIDEFEKRLGGVKHLSLVAEQEGQLVGFKVGYGISAKVFYSWLGGVLTVARGLGIAGRLLAFQEQWARDQGYIEIQVKTRNIHRNMLHFLVKHDYMVFKVEEVETAINNRIHFSKYI